jgi:mono/diheme cytochrome c family protein
MRRIASVVALGSAIALTGAGAWFAYGSPAATGPNARSEVAAGKAVYAQNCAVCHGVNLEGQKDWRIRKPDGKLPAPPHDASGHTWHHSDQQLFEITKNSLKNIVPDYESDMPAFKDVLSDDQIAAVLAYIKSTWPQQIQDKQKAFSGSQRP